MKQSIFCTMVLICLSLPTKAQVNLEDGLVAFWAFNSHANDESGNGNDGIVNGATLTVDRFLTPNSAYLFDGSNSFIELPNNVSIKPDFPFTISLWCKIDSFSDLSSVIYASDEVTGVYTGFWIGYIPSGNFSAGYGDGNGQTINNRLSKHSNSIIDTSSWHHLIAIFNGLNDIDLYVDGELDEGYYSGFGNSMGNLNSNGVIGRSHGHNLNSYHNGKIDDIRLFNRVLNEDEVLELFYESHYHVSFDNLFSFAGRVIEIPINTGMLTNDDNIIAFQFDLNIDNTKLEYISSTTSGTLAEGGSLQVSSAPEKLAIAWASEAPIVGEGAIIKVKCKVIDAGVSKPTITNGLFNTQVIGAINGTIASAYKYGDVDVNDHIQAYDAALAIQYSIDLDPIPSIDPLPWENWRIVTTDVDGIGGITANDASEILKYTVGIITQFSVEDTKKSASASSADISVEVENREIILKSTGELFGLNVFVNENFSALGQPESLVENALFAKNISATNYTFALATAYSPENNANVVKIPYSTNQNQSITFDMIVNTEVKSVTVGLTTGIVTINEQSVILYPNPANSVLYLSGVENVNVSIFDISGRNVFNQLNVNKQIDISALPKGVYTVKIETGKENITRKLIKN